MTMNDEQVKRWCNWCRVNPVGIITDEEDNEPVDHGMLCFACDKLVRIDAWYNKCDDRSVFDWVNE